MRVGFNVLERRYDIELAQPLRVESTIASMRARRDEGGRIENQYQASYRPADSLEGHFEFGLKDEEIQLEFLARLFAAIGPEPVETWCRREPFGQYARRASFLYEWLMGQRLDVPDLTNGRYVDAISSQHYLARVEPLRERRWRINHKLPGTAAFCPLVRRTTAVLASLTMAYSQFVRNNPPAPCQHPSLLIFSRQCPFLRWEVWLGSCVDFSRRTGKCRLAGLTHWGHLLRTQAVQQRPHRPLDRIWHTGFSAFVTWVAVNPYRLQGRQAQRFTARQWHAGFSLDG